MTKKAKTTPPRRRRPTSATPAAFPVVGVGASAGGLEAFTQLLEHLPVDTNMAFVLVQHLDPQHESVLAQLLTRATKMPVQEVVDGVRLAPNQVYVIPPGKQMAIRDNVLRLQPRRAGRTPPRLIDLFFESLAADRQELAIGVILSGTATDGTLGLEAIKGEGGITFAQGATAKYNSMPRSAVATGCVDYECSPEEIAGELARLARHPFISSWSGNDRSSGTDPVAASSVPAEAGSGVSASAAARRHLPWRGWIKMDGASYKNILHLVRAHAGTDFSAYKPATIDRRIRRRMVLSRLDSLEGYARLVRGNPHELDLLYADLLIGVTSFFRNPDAFEYLQRQVLPAFLLKNTDTPVRMWVLGCSTGQEAYSLAMAFAETMDATGQNRELQIFATDLNEASLEKARAGFYPASLVRDLSRERLGRFFTEELGGYRINKELRKSVVFARQNVLSDPPFSHMNLISCRNVLIYIEPSAQKKILPMFHYALDPGGVLFLGASESVAGFSQFFAPADRKQKIFKKTASVAGGRAPVAGFISPARKTQTPAPPLSPRSDAARSEVAAQREADRISVSRFAPPGVLIDGELQILQFRGSTGAYLEPPRGKASTSLLKMAREGLMFPLRAAIAQAKKTARPVSKAGLSLDAGRRHVTLQVIPLKNLAELHFLVLFEEISAAESTAPSVPLSKKEEGHRVRLLEQELRETRDFLRSVQEHNEVASDELQLSNEEVSSSNEELQSINEELETSKEELESANEELRTVNEEMVARNGDLNGLNADLNNLHVSIDAAIIVVAGDLTVRSFTPPAEKTFGITAVDLGRPLNRVAHHLSFPPPSDSAPETAPVSLEDLVREAVDSARPHDCEVQDRSGHWYSLRIRPYVTFEKKIDGAVVLLVDIDALKRSVRAVAVARDYAEATLRTARDPLLVLRGDLLVNTANEAFYKTFQTTREETEGRSFWELGGGRWRNPLLRQMLGDVLPRHSVFNEFEMACELPGVGIRTMLLNARQLDTPDDSPEMILLAIEDVTERLRLDDAVRRSEERFRALTVASAQVVWTADERGLNPADADSWATYTGLPAEKVAGLGWLDAVHPEDRESVSGKWEDSLAHGRIYQDEYRLRRATGEFRWTAARAVPIHNRDGTVREWIGTNTDIHLRREAAQRIHASESRFRGLFEASRDGLLLIDPLTRQIADANPFASRLLGYARDEIIGRELWQVGLFPDDAAVHARLLRLHNEGFFREENLKVSTKDGRLLAAEISWIIQQQDGKKIVQCSVRDLTARNRAAQLDTVKTEMFEMSLQGASLGGVLMVLVRSVQTQSQPAAAAVILLANVGTPGLRLVAATGLSERYLAAVGDLPFDAGSSSCGKGAFALRREIVTDIRQDSRWAPELDLVRETAIRGCWSFPIVNYGGEILGALAVYCDDPREPGFADVVSLESMAAVAAIFIDRYRAEATLRASEERYRTLFNSIDEGFAVIELVADAGGQVVDYRFVEVNQGFERQSGLVQAKGRRVRELVPDLESRWFEIFQQVAETGQPRRFTEEAGALKRWFDVYAFRPSGPDRSRIGVVFSDISDRKRAEDSHAWLAAIVDSSTDAIIGMDLDGLVTSWNDGAVKLFQFPAADAVGHHVSAVIPAIPAVDTEDLQERVRRGEQIGPFETIRRARDGTAVEVSLSISPVRDLLGVIVGAAKIARDIRPQRRVALELERVRDAVVSASRAKDEFLAALSHELRTPLTPVLLLAGEAADDPALPAETRALFESIRKNVSLEARLIDDLLDLTRISTGKLKLDLDPCDLHAILTDAFAIVRGDLDDKRLRLVVDFGAKRAALLADAVRLQQVFWNILRNAVHFTPAGGTIRVESRDDPAGDQVTIKITDTGVGLETADLQRIFEAFSQGEISGSGATRRFGGLGLGLAISRTLVGLHGGTIEASSPGRGSGATFTVRLPLAPADRNSPALTLSNDPFVLPPPDQAAIGASGAPLPPPAVDGPAVRLLLVEDNKSTLRILTTLLERRHIAVSPASSVAEALALAGAQEFDCLIADIGLPDEDGYSLMRQLRTRFPRIRGVALSGYGTDSDIAKSVEAGFAEHLAKPVNIAAFDQMVARLRRHRATLG